MTKHLAGAGVPFSRAFAEHEAGVQPQHHENENWLDVPGYASSSFWQIRVEDIEVIKSVN